MKKPVTPVTGFLTRDEFLERVGAKTKPSGSRGPDPKRAARVKSALGAPQASVEGNHTIAPANVDSSASREATEPTKDERNNRVLVVYPYSQPDRAVEITVTNGMAGGKRVYLANLPVERLADVYRAAGVTLPTDL